MARVRKAIRILAVVPLILVAACGADKPPATTPAAPASAPVPASASMAAPPTAPLTSGDPARIAASLSDEDLVGQVLMPYAFGSSATTVDKASMVANRGLAGVDTPAQMVAKFHLGGMILVSFTPGDPTGRTNATTNVDDPAQVRDLTAGLQTAAAQQPSRLPLLIGTDQEFGVVTRVKAGVTALPAAMAFGAAGKPALTEVVHLVGYGDRATDLDPAAAVTVMMDTPYLLSAARSATLIATYSSSPLSLTALANVLAGKAKAAGHAPVAVAGLPRSAC
jgi:beta-N-acetylhexosaminidase